MQAQALAGHPVPENYFAQLSAINVNGHVEKKGGFSYLSWPYAVAQLRLADPSATWEVRRFGGLPYLATEAGVFVAVAVTVHGVWGCRWSGCWRTSVWPHSRPFRPASSRAWCAAWRSGVRRFDALAALSRFFQRSAGSVRSRGSRPAPLLTRFIMIVSLPPGTIVALPQGSPEWHCYRQSRRNASESVAVLRLNPWITSYQLWLTKTGRFEPPVTQAMQRGTDLEPVARAAYEAETGLVMQPLVLEAGAYSASLDGMTVEGELIVEIKCRLRGTRSDLWEDVRQGQVPKHYTVQVQHQMMASGAATAHLWVFDGQQGMLHAIGRDAALMERIQNGWEGFQRYLDQDIPPPLSEADTRQRSDDAWRQAAQAFAQSKQRADEAAAALEAARAQLITLAQHPREQGAGVTVTRDWKQGGVDYKRIPELKTVDLDLFRRRASEEVRITVAG